MIDTEFDSQQIETAFPQYKFDKVLGRGAYGKVFLVTERETGEQFAVKKISCFGLCDYERNNAVNEVRILASLDHNNIIKFKSGMFDNNEDDLYLFMEYAPEGDLNSLLEQAKEKKKFISENMIWNIILQLASGLQYLHKHNILHRDIKPANIFRSGKTYKLADMNVSKVISNGNLAKTKAGSPLYVCPEVWKEEGYDEKCDVWSLGILAYELCCHKVPYEANSIEELIRKQKTVKIKNIPHSYSSELNQLIHQMLQYFPKRRLSAEKVRLACMKHFRVETQDNLQLLDPLINTIVIPQGEQRWINLVPLPPKSKKEIGSILERRDSRQKTKQDVMPNKSNIFVSLQNKSLLIPRNKNSLEKGPRPIRLPSIQRKSSIRENESRVTVKSRQKSQSRCNSRVKSRGKHLEHLEGKTREETPERKQMFSERITRKN